MLISRTTRIGSERTHSGRVLAHDMGARGINSARARRRSGRLVAILVLSALASIGRASAVTAPGGSSPDAVTAPGGSSPDAVPGRALVRFQQWASATAQQAAHLKAGATVIRRAAGYDVVSFPEQISMDVVLGSYRNDPAVAVAEPDYRARLALVPTDPCVSGPCGGVAGQYALALTNAYNGWTAFPGRTYTAAQKTSAVTIAVLDTKIDITHPDFANAGSPSTDSTNGGQIDVAGARDWIDQSRQSGSAAYHGTYVAGLAAAATGNGRGIASIGFAARVLPLTIVDGSGTAEASSLADAIVYAWQRGARVINLSLGLTADSHAVHDAIKRVTMGANPSLVVAAAGNNTGAAAFYPGSYPEVMSVGGTGALDNKASCANHNSNISVSAPAEKVVSLLPGGGEYAAPCGTSAATPQVSALAALLFTQDTTRTPATVRSIIEKTADDLGATGRDNLFGAGRIDVERALRYQDGSPVTTLARASVPLIAKGASIVTALATSPKGVKAAEVRLDSPESAPVPMRATDNNFGGTTEALTTTLDASRLAAGPHPIWIRAFDGSTWGPSNVGVLIVDRTAPSMANLAASNGVRAVAQPVSITFTAWDTLSPTITYAIAISNTADHKVVFTAVRSGVGGGQQRYDWTPDPNMLPGKYDIKLAVADQAGNMTQQLAGSIVT